MIVMRTYKCSGYVVVVDDDNVIKLYWKNTKIGEYLNEKDVEFEINTNKLPLYNQHNISL